MEDPMKIIHKYKNNNGRIQYHIHIFIGDIVDNKCMKVLQKIKDLDLYEALVSLTVQEREIITENYGEFWYEKFFNSYHINNIKETTKNNRTKVAELESIYSRDWFVTHFIDYVKRLEVVTYSYEYSIREERGRKMARKSILHQQQEVEDLVYYSTMDPGRSISDTNNRINTRSLNIRGSQDKPFKIVDDVSQQDDWCEFDSESSDSDAFENSNSYEESVYEVDDNFDSRWNSMRGGQFDDISLEDIEDTDDLAEMELDDEFKIDDPDDPENPIVTDFSEDPDSIDALFSDIDDMDKNIKLTTREIKEAISNKAYHKLNRQISEFDTSNDNSMFDENLKDIYRKNYITHQYIYKDDTIKTIHNKICCGFKNNNRFGENSYIIPSYQYLWSEYQLDGKIEKIMIGQKWIIRNNILSLEVEPNTNIGVYEDLRGNLKTLRDNIRRHGKIKREDDDNNIFYDYEGYYTYNEIFMIDIYNELGLNYNPVFEELKNLADVYLRVYFPRIRSEDFRHIIEYLDSNTPMSKKSLEKNKLSSIFDTLNNNLILENENMRDIELVKKENKDYTKLFKENYVNQSFLRAYLLDKNTKIDLFRIFDNFILDENHPFIQYQPSDGTPRSRYNQEYLIKNERKEIIMKWFENSPYGISFKVRVNEATSKYMSISLSDTGRIDYKIQWKESDKSTIDDINKTYPHVRNLIAKINEENSKYGINLNIPSDDDFHFAFVNTIQKFELPEDFVINHNDLSEFSRYFFPYAALVVEPRKRQSKIHKDSASSKSKFGTYLRYKRVSKYDSKLKIERRILSFMKNYEFNDQSLTNEISKEFNITEEQAFEEIEAVRAKYPNVKKSRKVLKKMDNITKFKPPGIGVDIQGKSRENYKIRIDGARSRGQLNRIVTFMNILIYLYTETYLYKRPERQRMKDKLKRLTKIARRRNKVDEVIIQDTPIKSIKHMVAMDRKRLSYKGDEDQNQWSRNCQNSGENKRRQPQQYLSEDELLNLGYVWNEELDGFQFGHYAKKVQLPDKSSNNKKSRKGKNKEVTIRAIKLPLDDTGENFVYYACDPELNGKHMYIGFLNKSKNPYGEPMPCCFIKDHLYSKNKEKRKYYLQGIGALPPETTVNTITGDQLYILQDSNKIQEGRFAFLPKYLDIFMNYMLQNERIIRNHYLASTPHGYYFKYGTRQDSFRYLNAIGSILDLDVEEIKGRMIDSINRDNDLMIFTCLNNGDIRSQFKTPEAYVLFLETNEYLEYPLINDLLSIPQVLTPHGINIIIFQKKLRIIRRSLEREKVKESYYVVCQNPENIRDLTDPKRECLFIIKEGKNYYPIVMVKKEDDASREVEIIKTFKYGRDKRNIVKHILEYYQINCQTDYDRLISDQSSGNSNAKDTIYLLRGLAERYQPKHQVIDARFKCQYVITNDNSIIPVIPSGTVYDVPVIGGPVDQMVSSNRGQSYLQEYTQDFDKTRTYLNKINRLTENRLNLKPIGVFYNNRKADKFQITAIMTSGNETVPIKPFTMTLEQIQKEKLQVRKKHNYDEIDYEIALGANNFQLDNRIYSVSKDRYDSEIYQLFRFHLSYFLNNIPMGLEYKNRIEKIINDNNPNKNQKRIAIKKLLYRMCDSDLAKKFAELIKRVNEKQRGGDRRRNKFKSIEIIPRDFSTRDKRPRSNLRDTAMTPDNEEFNYHPHAAPPAVQDFQHSFVPETPETNFKPEDEKWLRVFPRDEPIDYPNIKLNNIRELCYINFDADSCALNQHCSWSKGHNLCLLNMRQDSVIEAINKVTEELVQNDLRAQEILRKDNYFVSDIVSYDIYTERPGERIVVASNTNLNKILAEVFGKENIPQIGKKRNRINVQQNYDQMNLDNPMKKIGNWYIQTIIENNNTIFRAFANAYYWLTHPYSEPEVRNLGYYSQLQTNLSNIYKGQVVDWILDPNNLELIQTLGAYYQTKPFDYAVRLSREITTFSNCLLETLALSSINQTVIYINDNNYNVVMVFRPNKGLVYDRRQEKREFNINSDSKYKKVINLFFGYQSKSLIPVKIDVMYPRK